VLSLSYSLCFPLASLPNQKSTPMLLSHSVGIYARASELEKYVPNFLPILDKHLGSIEPHLGEIMEQVRNVYMYVCTRVTNKCNVLLCFILF